MEAGNGVAAVKVRVRAFEQSDLSAVRDLFSAYHQWLGLDLSYQNYKDEFDSLPGAYDPRRGGALLLAVRETEGGREEALGCVALRPLVKSYYNDQSCYCEIKRLFVVPAARGMRVGNALVMAILNEAQRSDYRFCVLDTLDTMKGAIHLYKSFGFGQIEQYYDTPIRQTIFLRKTLPGKR